MATRVNDHLQYLSNKRDAERLRNLFDESAALQTELVTYLTTMSTDIDQIVTDLNALVTAYNATLAKLDADSGDTGGDSDYAATNPGVESTVDSSAPSFTGGLS